MKGGEDLQQKGYKSEEKLGDAQISDENSDSTADIPPLEIYLPIVSKKRWRKVREEGTCEPSYCLSGESRQWELENPSRR